MHLSKILAGSLLAFAAISQAAPVVWTNNAGTPHLQSFDLVTGARVDNYVGSGSNGRGVVTVGDIIYTTDSSTGFVGKFNRNTGASLGGCNIAGVNGISTISYDGDNFWTSDYTGSNKAYKIDQNCQLLKTISLSRSQGNYDGLEYFKGKLIANRFDGGFTGGNQYSVYDTDGNLLQADFIDTTGHGNGTGIAFNGTDFYISDIFNNRLTIWSGATGAFLGALNLQQSANVIEDISFDFEARDDTCRINCTPPTTDVPEPGSLGLVALALVAAGYTGRRTARKAGKLA